MIVEVPVSYPVTAVRAGRRNPESLTVVTRVPVSVREIGSPLPLAIETRPLLGRVNEAAQTRAMRRYPLLHRTRWHECDGRLFEPVRAVLSTRMSDDVVHRDGVHLQDLLDGFEASLPREGGFDQEDASFLMRARINPFVHPDVPNPLDDAPRLLVPEGTVFRSVHQDESTLTRDEAIAFAMSAARRMVLSDGVLFRESDGPVWTMQTSVSSFRSSGDAPGLILSMGRDEPLLVGNSDNPEARQTFRADHLDDAQAFVGATEGCRAGIQGRLDIYRPDTLRWDDHLDEARRIAGGMDPDPVRTRMFVNHPFLTLLAALREAGSGGEADALAGMANAMAREARGGAGAPLLESRIGAVRAALEGMMSDERRGEGIVGRITFRGLPNVADLETVQARGKMARDALVRIAPVHNRCLQAMGRDMQPIQPEAQRAGDRLPIAGPGTRLP